MKQGHAVAKAGPLAVLLAVIFGCGTALADVPAPGTHGITKTWPSVGATVTNFSPFTSISRISALTSDVHGGVWFGVGNTLEHIDGAGTMRNYQISSEGLWTVGGISNDGAGRVWFSLGQSGRIGTIDASGRLHTRVIVARKNNPDLGEIAFDGRGTLWFTDFGRKSIGRETADGRVREIPLPDDANNGSFGHALAVCGSKIYIAARSVRADTIFAVDNDLQALHSVLAWRQAQARGYTSIACDGAATLWFAHAPYQSGSVDGYLDSAGRAHMQPGSMLAQRVYAGAHGTIWFTGFQAASNMDWNSSRLIIAAKSGDRVMRWTLPVSFGALNQTLTTTPDGTLWLDTANPHSVIRLKFDK